MENNNPFNTVPPHAGEIERKQVSVEESKQEIAGLNAKIEDVEREREAAVTYQSMIKKQMDASSQKEGSDWNELVAADLAVAGQISHLDSMGQQYKDFIKAVESQMATTDRDGSAHE